MLTGNRQTVSFLIKRFQQAGIHLDTRHGQNFLIDLNLVALLVDSAELTPQDIVLEVGTGTGSLTHKMATRAGWVVTVEIDSRLYQLAREELYECDNVTMLLEDALRNKNNLQPHVMESITEAMQLHDLQNFKLAANLPYNIATPIISNLLRTDNVPKLMCVTIQKELADRITALPGTKDYNALSIWIQSQCETEIIRVLPPDVFWPRPKVHSAIIRIRPDKARREQIPDLAFFHTFVRSIFCHRRKFLRSVLLAAFKKQLGKAEIDDAIHELHLDGQCRAEQLDVTKMIALCESIRQRIES